MATPKLSWNQLVSGKRPRGTGDLGQLRAMLWRALRVAEEALYNAVQSADEAMVVKYLHVIGILAARYRDVYGDSELEIRVAAIEAQLNGSPTTGGVQIAPLDRK